MRCVLRSEWQLAKQFTSCALSNGSVRPETLKFDQQVVWVSVVLSTPTCRKLQSRGQQRSLVDLVRPQRARRLPRTTTIAATACHIVWVSNLSYSRRYHKQTNWPLVLPTHLVSRSMIYITAKIKWGPGCGYWGSWFYKDDNKTSMEYPM